MAVARIVSVLPASHCAQSTPAARALRTMPSTSARSFSGRQLRIATKRRTSVGDNEEATVASASATARAAGVDCAQWEAGGTETILATAIDGAATQGFLLVSPAGRKKRISSIL